MEIAIIVFLGSILFGLGLLFLGITWWSKRWRKNSTRGFSQQTEHSSCSSSCASATGTNDPGVGNHDNADSWGYESVDSSADSSGDSGDSGSSCSSGSSCGSCSSSN